MLINNTFQLPIGKTYTSEVNFFTAPTALQIVKFTETPIFSNAQISEYIRIKGIMAYTSDAIKKSPGGNDVISLNGLESLYLNIVGVDSKSILWDFPCLSLYPFLNGGIYYEFDNLKINFTACYLKVNVAGNIAAGESAVFTWIYEDIRDKAPKQK